MAKLDEKYICDRFQGLIEGMPPATTTEIAAELNVSYQAVHRLIKKNGLGRKDGGKAAQQAAKDPQDEASKVSGMCEKYGCTKDQWDELRAMDEEYKNTPLHHFHTFKNNFQNLNPNIPFELTLWEWWNAWMASGKWHLRKRNPEGMWILVQVDKALPMCNDNIQIIPFGEYLKSTRKVGPRKPKEVSVV